MPCTKVLIYPLNSAYFLSAEMSEILKKTKIAQKFSLRWNGTNNISDCSCICVLFIKIFMARSTVSSIFKRSSNNAFCGALETDVRAAKRILSPSAKYKNLIVLEVLFLEIVHPDLYSGKVWGFSMFSFRIPPGEILGWLLLS